MSKSSKLFMAVAAAIIIGLFAYANFLVGQGEKNNAAAQGQSGQAADSALAASGAADAQAASGTAAMGDYYAVFRSDRDSVRQLEMEYLNAITADQNNDAETRAEAAEQKLELVEAMEQEVIVEGLLRAKGFTNAAVTVSGGNVNVVLETAVLDDAQVAQVLDIVMDETGEDADDIKIIPHA